MYIMMFVRSCDISFLYILRSTLSCSKRVVKSDKTLVYFYEPGNRDQHDVDW